MTAKIGHIRCPKCFGNLEDVTDSRPWVFDTGIKSINAIRQRRHCPGCGARASTFEVTESDLEDMKAGMPNVLRRNIDHPELLALVGKLALRGGLS